MKETDILDIISIELSSYQSDTEWKVPGHGKLMVNEEIPHVQVESIALILTVQTPDGEPTPGTKSVRT